MLREADLLGCQLKLLELKNFRTELLEVSGPAVQRGTFDPFCSRNRTG